MGNPIPPQRIRDELARVLSSTTFVRNTRQSDFLRFLVERHLDGKDAELKETVIAVEVFGRAPGYDPKLDGIVRTEAVRLRARLSRYYATDGNHNELVIHIPKGGYRPAFSVRQQLGPITVSRRSWSWVAVGFASLGALATAGQLLTRPSSAPKTLAVLPLEEVGTNPGADSDSITDTLTDGITGYLSEIDGLTVRARTSSFVLKGKHLSASDAGRQLDVEFVVEGTIVRAAGQLRVDAELIRVRDEAAVWAHQFDYKLRDALAVAGDLSDNIVKALKLPPSGRHHQTNAEAYELYLRGRQVMASFPAGGPLRGGRPIAKLAVQYFEDAIAKDANSALAHAGLADMLRLIDENIVDIYAYDRSKRAAERAIELDPLLSEAQAAMAGIRAHEYAWQDAERGFRRAIELNSNNALAHLELGASVLVPQGRLEQGIGEARLATALDPLSPYVNTEFGRVLVEAGRYGEAVAQLRRALALDPARPRAYAMLGRALYLNGNTSEALRVLEQGKAHGGLPSGTQWSICEDMRLGNPDEARARFKQQVIATHVERNIASMYACLGDAERTLEFLGRAIAAREPGILDVLEAPEFTWMRADPRFARIRQQLSPSPAS
jgi:TolB-like protein/Tfp pilus assembly protein PilF